MGNAYFSNHSLGTGACTCVFCNVAGMPSGPMKCFSGTNRPERVLAFHCSGFSSCSAARSSSTATGGCEAVFGGTAGGVIRRLLNWIALHQMARAQMKRKTAAAISTARS